MELLKFSNEIEAADAERRILAGRIVPFDTEIGSTSAGKVIFKAGSIEIPTDKKIKLLDEHNPKAILGSALNFVQSNEGIGCEKEDISIVSSSSDAVKWNVVTHER